MKRVLTTMSLVAALMLTMAPAVLAGGSGSGGHTADQLADAGWNCFNAGPSNWTHCVPPANGSGGAKAITVKVFGVEGSPFLGTEILLSADVYNGQPCMTDGGEPYSYVPPFDAYACHHFDTGH
ncbi:MAG: hypothetical protein V3S38_07405 [Acidimicrobiia bacterium]